MHRRRRDAGLTLIELLAAAAILSALAALVLPAVQYGRAASRRMSCQFNPRQWTIAALRFADDHEGDLPRRGQGVQRTERFDRPQDWFNALPPYVESIPLSRALQADKDARVGGVWLCPSLLQTGRPVYFAYGMNMWLSTWKSKQPDNVAKIETLGTMVFMADGIGTQCSVLPSDKPYSPEPRHEGLVNLSFLDGHVAAKSAEFVGCGVGIQQRDELRWIVPESLWTGPDDQ